MDLSKFEDHSSLDVLMDNQFSQSMFILGMAVTQADLLIARSVETNGSHVEELDIVLERHPEDAIYLIIIAQLVPDIIH